MAKQRRRLEDLYTRGRELPVDDGSGDPVVVWIQKLNPLEHEKSLRKAGAAKAQVLIARHNRDSDEWQEAYSDADDLGGREGMIEYVMGEEIMNIRRARETELAFRDEWAKDGYLKGLQDAWEDGLEHKYAVDTEDPEASRVFLEMKRFADQVAAEVDPEIENAKRSWEELDDEVLRVKAVDKFIELRAGLAWLREYRRCEVYFCTRDPDDHKHYYFPDREAVDTLSPEVFGKITEAYEQLTVDPDEGKGLPRSQPSSDSSESPSDQEVSAPSGLQVVTP